MVNSQAKCVHCGGALRPTEEGRKCLLCSRVSRTNTETHRFYKSNQEDIFRDYNELGRKATIAKWQIPDGSFARLLRRFRDQKEPAAEVPAPPRKNGALPALPAFSDSWPPEVQVKWLDVYKAVAVNK